MSRRHKIECTSGPRGLTPIQLSPQREDKVEILLVSFSEMVGREVDIAQVWNF